MCSAVLQKPHIRALGTRIQLIGAFGKSRTSQSIITIKFFKNAGLRLTVFFAQKVFFDLNQTTQWQKQNTTVPSRTST
jgi:hypothetical protein